MSKTKPAAPTKLRTSGFCNPTLPRTAVYDPHQRCRGCDCRATGCPCAPVQEDPVPTVPDPATLTREQLDQVPTMDVSGIDTIHPLPDDAGGWVEQIKHTAEGLNIALLGYHPEDWRDAARLLYQLRTALETVRVCESSLVHWLYLHGEHGMHQVIDGVPGEVSITRGRARERWAAPEAVHAYVDAQLSVTGEVPDPRQVIEWVLEVVPATQSTSLRKTPLRNVGLDLDEFYWSEPGTLQVSTPRPT